MRRAILLVAAVCTVAAAGQAASAPSVRLIGFRMPSRNIACQYFRAEFGHKAVIRCDLLSGLRPQPTRHCELDWAGVAMTRRGKASPVCAGDTVYDKRLRILHYGHTWKHRGIGCKSTRAGLKCHNRRGHGFFLSRQRWRVY
jgi:uncharacterized protein DUF6636